MKELYYENSEYKLAPMKATYTDTAESLQVQYTDDPEWFNSFKVMHGGMDDLTIEEVSYTPQQISRLEECKNFPPSAEEDVYNYVVLGIVNVESPLFKTRVDEERLEAMESVLLEILLGGTV
jgi:hypothetical protein